MRFVRRFQLVCKAVESVAARLIGYSTDELFTAEGMQKCWDYLTGDPQQRWVGPECGVIRKLRPVLITSWRKLAREESLPIRLADTATGAVVNAIWELYAKKEKKPLWQLVADFTPEEFVAATSFRCQSLTFPFAPLDLFAHC